MAQTCIVFKLFKLFFRQLPYEDAVVECARRGSIILPVKDQEMHSFITKWASITGGDVWIGLQRKRWGQYFDENPAYNQPLQEVIEGIDHSNKTFYATLFFFKE